VTGLVLYAIVEEELSGPLPCGTRAEPLVQVDAGGVVAVAGCVDEPPEPTAAAALAHAAVVDELAERADPLLPARLGELYPSEDALRDALVRESEGLCRALRQARGCVELGVRARFLAPTGRPASGREYLERRGAEEARRERLHEPLRRLAAAALLEREADGFAGSYLVRKDRLDAFVAAVDRAAAEQPELGLAWSGPWPAYSFAGATP
jgi:hypothetical protein